MTTPRLLVIALVACGGGPPKQTATAPAAQKPPAAAASTADPGPRLERKVGATQVTRLPAVAAKASARGQDGRAVYLSVPYAGGASPEWIAISGAGHGFAVPGDGHILVRFPGKTVPDQFRLVWLERSDSDHEGIAAGSRVEITVTGGAAATSDAKLPTAFLRAASTWLAEHGRVRSWTSLPFYAFASARLGRLADGKATAADVAGRRRQTELADLMDLYTGMTSVDEALQTDRGLMLPADPAAQARKLDLAAIKPLEMPIHPWDRMIRELPGKPQPVVEPLAASVPADVLYVHAHDLRRLVQLARELDEGLAPILGVMEQRGGSAEMIARYERQLAVERTGLAERWGHLAAKGVALVSSDPFLREGTDVSMLFLVENASFLETALADYAQRAAARRPDVRRTEVAVGKHKGTLFATDDGEIRRYEVRLGNVHILSNSPGALLRLVEVAEGKRPSLAAAGDFRYFRALYPARAEAEDAFVFASDALILAVTGPRVKILEARRMQARAELAALNHAALLHGWLEGKAPASLDDVERAGLITKADRRHGDLAEIRFTPEGGARSSWGSLAGATPLVDLTLGKVSAAERDAYERFRETYQNYWRGYLDPIGARLRLGAEGGVDFDARMLPLISGTDYDRLREQVGRRTVSMPRPRAGAHFLLAVGDDAALRREVDRAAHSLSGRADLGIGWLGDWVALGAADRSAVWDLALWSREIPELAPSARARADREDFERQLWPRLPFYAMAHVRSKLALVATLTAVRKFADDAARGMLEWGPGGSFRGVEITRVGAKGEAASEVGDLALHYAVAGDVLCLAVDRGTLEHAIALVLDGQVAGKDRGAAAVQTAVAFDLAPKGYLRRTAAGFLEKLAERDTMAGARQAEALLRGLPAVRDAQLVRARGRAYLGEEPVAAVGGSYGLGDDGIVTHSRHGSRIAPIVLGEDAESPIAAALARFAGASFGISFEGEKDHLGLRSVGSWRRTKP